MGKQTIEELEAQVKQLAMHLELSVAAERAWETTMMRVCGEDGPLSVAGKFNQLAAENAALKELIEQHSSCVAVCPNCSHEEPSETDDIVALYRSMSTPATDAFLSSLRAEGVEMFANHQQKKYDNLVSSGKILTDTGFSHYLSGEASTFAAQLRSKSEVQS